jgi:hypothetical protein
MTIPRLRAVVGLTGAVAPWSAEREALRRTRLWHSDASDVAFALFLSWRCPSSTGNQLSKTCVTSVTPSLRLAPYPPPVGPGVVHCSPVVQITKPKAPCTHATIPTQSRPSDRRLDRPGSPERASRCPHRGGQTDVAFSIPGLRRRAAIQRHREADPGRPETHGGSPKEKMGLGPEDGKGSGQHSHETTEERHEEGEEEGCRKVKRGQKRCCAQQSEPGTGIHAD